MPAAARPSSRPGAVRRIARRLGLLMALAGLAPPLLAQSALDPDEVKELLRVKVRTVQHMALNPVLVRATLRQNRHDFEGALQDLAGAIKLQPHNAQAWLTQVLARIQDHKITRLDELLPWHYPAAAP